MISVSQCDKLKFESWWKIYSF